MSEQTEAARVSLAALVAAAGTGATGNFAGIVVGAVTQTAGSMVFTQGSGVTFGLSASTLTASVAAGATATGNLGAISAGAASVGAGTVVFSNSNGVSFGVNGSTVTASHNGLTAETQTFVGGIQGSGTSVATNGTVQFANSNGVTFGLSGSTITASAAGATTFIGGLAASSQSALTVTANTVNFSNANGVSFGLNSGANSSVMTGSVGSGATATGNVGALAAVGATATSGTVSFSNSNGVTFGMNGQTITASVAAAAAAPTVLLYNDQNYGALQQDMAAYHNAMNVFPLGKAPFPGNMTIGTLNIAFSGQTSITSLPAYSISVKVGLYALSNSTRLSLVNSVQWTTGSNATSSDAQQAHYAGQRMLSIHSSLWSAQPVLTQTNYWIGLMMSTAGASIHLSVLGGSFGLGNQNSINYGYVGAASFTTGAAGYPWFGKYSVTTAALPTSLARGDVGGDYAFGGGLNVNNRPWLMLQDSVGSI